MRYLSDFYIINHAGVSWSKALIGQNNLRMNFKDKRKSGWTRLMGQTKFKNSSLVRVGMITEW